MRKAIFLAPAIAAAAAICPASAQRFAQDGPVLTEDAAGPSSKIEIADLDLRSGEGLEVMQLRIDRAVDRLCAAVASEPLAIHARARCRHDALAQASAQVSRAVREAEIRALAGRATARRRAE
ncbi:MAG TPA: UrcA family protein [Allosphingosinicella sp.]|nr:UrcA family protein [Allosphingosinicella sp.]